MRKTYPAPELPPLQTYRVYVEQVNQTMIRVEARNEAEARELGYAKWRADFAHSRVLSVELDS